MSSDVSTGMFCCGDVVRQPSCVRTLEGLYSCVVTELTELSEFGRVRCMTPDRRKLQGFILRRAYVKTEVYS